MTNPALIQHIEELSMNAFPPLHSIHDDGWVMQLSAGYTARRANAVYPLYAGSKPLEEKIANCEALYHAQGLPTLFKLTKASIPPTLDDVLATKGYSETPHTAIQLLALGGWSGHADADVILTETPSEAWLAAFGRMHEDNEKDHQTYGQIVNRILPARRFASVSVDGQVVACGLGVLQNGYIGFYSVATDSSYRRQGHSLRLMQTLLVWAKSQGATHAYLQVMLNNPPALALYEKLGFRQIYEYWYRTQA